MMHDEGNVNLVDSYAKFRCYTVKPRSCAKEGVDW